MLAFAAEGPLPSAEAALPTHRIRRRHRRFRRWFLLKWDRICTTCGNGDSGCCWQHCCHWRHRSGGCHDARRHCATVVVVLARVWQHSRPFGGRCCQLLATLLFLLGLCQSGARDVCAGAGWRSGGAGETVIVVVDSSDDGGTCTHGLLRAFGFFAFLLFGFASSSSSSSSACIVLIG